jgi:hypothetical protein
VALVLGRESIEANHYAGCPIMVEEGDDNQFNSVDNR